MATNVDEKIDANVDTEGIDGDASDTGNGQSGSSRRTRFLNLCRLLLHLVCSGYSLYIIWLLAYLKDNNNHWCLSFIPIFFNFFPFLAWCMAYHINGKDTEFVFLLLSPSIGVVLNLMACFTMLTRQAYYHRQPDELIGPRFIIGSLQGSITLFFADFFLQREGKLDHLLHYKDALSRMLLDFVDIFNMVEILSLNDCVGVGSFVSEESSKEKAIQAFCTLSFCVVLSGLNDLMTANSKDGVDFSGRLVDKENQRRSSMTRGELLCSVITMISVVLQNVPFLVIRIVVWAQYKLYSLGFLVKNVTVIVLYVAIYFKDQDVIDILFGHHHFSTEHTFIAKLPRPHIAMLV